MSSTSLFNISASLSYLVENTERIAIALEQLESQGKEQKPLPSSFIPSSGCIETEPTPNMFHAELKAKLLASAMEDEAVLLAYLKQRGYDPEQVERIAKKIVSVQLGADNIGEQKCSNV